MPNALENAVDELLGAGVSRAAISVLGTDPKRSGHIETLYRSAEQIEDDPDAQRVAFVSRDSKTEGKAFAIALPFQIGGMAGAWAVAVAGGALATGIGAALVGGVAGAGLGAILLRAVARHHAGDVHSQIEQGGSVVWVSTPDAATEQRALEVLHRCGGTSVHTHEIARDWGTRDSPLHDVQPDPFLERDPS
jgi:hypothetical protein